MNDYFVVCGSSVYNLLRIGSDGSTIVRVTWIEAAAEAEIKGREIMIPEVEDVEEV